MTGENATGLKPLNGTRIHPLSPHALFCLRCIEERPRPRQTVNPGVANRLERGALVQTVRLPSPFKTHKGRLIDHLEITDAGRAAISRATGRPPE